MSFWGDRWKLLVLKWRPRRDLNPCYRRESNYKAAVATQRPVGVRLRARWNTVWLYRPCTANFQHRVPPLSSDVKPSCLSTNTVRSAAELYWSPHYLQHRVSHG